MTQENTLNTTFAPTQLSSIILDNNAPADGHSKISIFYTLTDAAGAPAAGEYLRFTLQGSSSAVLDATMAPTTVAGQFLLGITNTQAQGVTVRAEVLSNPNIYNTSQIIFGSQSVAITAETLSDNAPANGVSENRVLFTLKNPTTDERYPNVYLDIKSSNGAQPEEYVERTDENGYVELLLTNTVEGNVWIDARSQAPFAAETAHVVTFTEGTVQPAYHLSAGSVFGPADGATEVAVPFTLTDARTGLPVSGQLLAFALADGTGQLVNTGGQTDASGIVYARVTSAVANTVSITGYLVSDSNIRTTAEVLFTQSLPQYVLTGTLLNNTTPVGEELLVQYRLINANTQLPVAGEVIKYYMVSGTASPTHPQTPQGITNADGITYGFFVSNGVAGTSVVRGYLNRDPEISDTTAITFVPAEAQYNLASEVLNNNAPANGSTPNQVRFTLRNIATNQPVSNQVLIFSSSGAATIEPQSAYTDINGQVTVAMTSVVVGSQQLTGYLQSTSAVTTSASMNFTDSLANYQINVNAITNAVPGNAIAQNQIRFTLTNSGGVPQSGRIIDFTQLPGHAILQ